jgi:hypothetical protein
MDKPGFQAYRIIALGGNRDGQYRLGFAEFLECARQLLTNEGAQPTMRTDPADECIRDGIRLQYQRTADQVPLVAVLVPLPRGEKGPRHQQDHNVANTFHGQNTFSYA